MKMTAIEVAITNVYEMLNSCNRAPNPKQDSPNRLFIATEYIDDLAKFRVVGSTYPAGLSDRIKVGLFNGSTCVETGHLQNDGEWAFYTVPSANVATCQLKFGVDGNGDGILQDDECGGDTGFTVVPFNSEEYDAQNSWLFSSLNGVSSVFKVGSTMLLKFLNGYDLPDPPDDLVLLDFVNCFNFGGLTHNAGEVFSQDGNGVICRYVWDEGTKAAERVVESLEIDDVINGMLLAHTNAVVSYFASHPNENIYLYPIGITNQLINFQETNPLVISEYDLHIAFGHATIRRIDLDCEFIRLPSGDITTGDVICTGILEDLYDFNFEDGGLAQRAATLQLGWESGSLQRQSGRVFFSRVIFEKTFSMYPFTIMEP